MLGHGEVLFFGVEAHQTGFDWLERQPEAAELTTAKVVLLQRSVAPAAHSAPLEAGALAWTVLLA